VALLLALIPWEDSGRSFIPLSKSTKNELPESHNSSAVLGRGSLSIPREKLILSIDLQKRAMSKIHLYEIGSSKLFTLCFGYKLALVISKALVKKNSCVFVNIFKLTIEDFLLRSIDL